jgi:hypothetical protein
MIKPEYIELMNQELDGANSTEQSRNLEKYLSSHEEARTYYRELAQAVDVFTKVDMLSPPPGLGNSILAQVDQRAGRWPVGAASPGHRSLWDSLRDLLRPGLKPAYAFTFATGLILGLALFAGSEWIQSGRSLDQADYVSGTANHRVLDHGTDVLGVLNYPGLSGRYGVRREGNDLRLHLELASVQPAMVQFRFGPKTVLLHYNSDNPEPATLKAGRSAAELSHTGDGRYDLVFRLEQDSQTPVIMSVFSEGGLIHSETLSGPGK